MYGWLLRFSLYMTLALRLLIIYRNIREELSKQKYAKSRFPAKARNKKNRLR